jgi:hypothetical protein
LSQSLRVSRIHLAALLDTVLWRALVYARTLSGHSPFVARQLRRAVLLLWWTATFQLHIHFRYWVRARRLRGVTPPPVRPLVMATVDPLTLDVPTSEDPVVSIIIPTYGQVPFTLRCLASIAQHTAALPIEVIVIDDAWDGVETAALAVVCGIRLLRNKTNLGFLHSSNKAAALAKGRYLCFLNNDTQVLEGWLEPMVSLFRQSPGTGAVGARLLYPDGRLQEAGGVVWQDATAWNFGRLEDPARPAYNYVREVDYCSGAALMVERTVFADLGGFDPRYAPAYFEDTDLCFRLRQIGLNLVSARRQGGASRGHLARSGYRGRDQVPPGHQSADLHLGVGGRPGTGALQPRRARDARARPLDASQGRSGDRSLCPDAGPGRRVACNDGVPGYPAAGRVRGEILAA